MSKANNLLAIYVEKITNGKSGTMKFVSDFDNFTLDLLYTSLQIMSNKDTITKAEYNKLDKKELSYYIKKVKGISGCTQLGDGSIALILDPVGLIE